MKPRVLFVCTGNSGRSQMAQTMLRDSQYSGCVMHEVRCNTPGDDPIRVAERTMCHHRRLWPQAVPD